MLVCVCLLSGSNYYVRILSTIDRELLKPSASVALHKHSNALVDVLPPEADSSITMLSAGRLHLLSWLYHLSYVSSAILSRLEVFICHHFFLLLVIFSESLHNFCRIFIVDMFCIELQLVILWFYYLNCIISKKVLYYGYHASNIIEENCSGFCLMWVC